MNVHYLQHVPYEGLGSIKGFLEEKQYEITSTHLYHNESIPSVSEFDWLIILGGPMGIYEEDQYPWLIPEKRFIKEAIDQNKLILGICLGSQLIADALDAKIKKNPHEEIGWFKLYPVEHHFKNINFPDAELFHWHGDTFEIPEEGSRLAYSEACANQAFIKGERILGVQFHLEASQESLNALLDHCDKYIEVGKYTQSKKEILSNTTRFHNANIFMRSLLESFIKASKILEENK